MSMLMYLLKGVSMFECVLWKKDFLRLQLQIRKDSTVQKLKIIVVFVMCVRHDIPLIPDFVSECLMLSLRVIVSVNITVQYVI